MEKYNLPIDTINKVLGYLGKRPYEEVSDLIAEVQQNAEKLDIVKPETKKKVKSDGRNKTRTR